VIKKTPDLWFLWLVFNAELWVLDISWRLSSILGNVALAILAVNIYWFSVLSPIGDKHIIISYK
jgi:hypothetical protein